MRLVFSIVLSCVVSSSLLAQGQSVVSMPQPPQLNLKSYVLMDFHSGQVIAQYQAHEPIEPASLTKMMTMYVIDNDLEQGRVKISEQVLISPKARNVEGSRMYVEENSKVPVSELIQGIIVQSGNDASLAMAEHLAGDESTFAELMNVYAKKIGMKDTHFKNATGLPTPGHVTTAYDMALLSRALIKDFPKTYNLYSQKTFSYNNIEQSNRNRLLWESQIVDGIKTGHTQSAGYCLASSAVKDGMRLIAVVIGAETDKVRTFESMRLLSYGFRFFETIRLQKSTDVLSHERVWFGGKSTIPLALKDDLYVTIPTGTKDRMKAQLRVIDKIHAPVKQGQELGQIDVYMDDQMLNSTGLYAAESVDLGSLPARIKDNISMNVQKIFQKEKNKKDLK